jgi:hypothetical protein
MENKNYISEKEEKLWKAIRIVSALITWLTMIFFTISENRLVFLYWLGFGTLLLTFLADIPQRFNEKDISEIRKRLSWNAVVYAAGLVIFILLSVLLSAKTAFVVFGLIVWLIILNFIVFRKRIQNSTSFLHYLVDDKPGLFYKDIFSSNYAESILVIVALVITPPGLIALAIWGPNISAVN